MKFADVETKVKEFMLLEDKGVLRLVCATLLSNNLTTPSSWIFIVGNSSGGKSMILSALKPVTGIFEIDDMTAQTFASGQKGQGQASLLHQLPLNGTMLIKDYTTILSKEEKSRSQIVGQMRKIFDGDYRKKFGNGEDVQWQGKLGMLAGTTTEIYSMGALGDNAALGERYLYYMVDMPDREEVGMLASDMLEDSRAKLEMSQAFQEYLNPIIDNIGEQSRAGTLVMPKLDEPTRREIVRLAEMATRARSSVKRNMYSRERDVEMVHALELPPRFVKAVVCIAYGLLLLHRYDGEPEELTDQDRAILFKTSLDSIPLSRRRVLSALALQPGSEKDLRARLQLPHSTIQMFINDLYALGVLDIIQSGTWIYELKPQYKRIMEQYRYLDMATKTLSEDAPPPDRDEVPVPEEPGAISPEGMAELKEAGLI